MKEKQIAIVGGGLAGLTAAIHLATAGLKPMLFEKDIYPHHKVCGEYLSREVIPYLNSLSVDIETLKPGAINQLQYSTPKGKVISTGLPLGGIGVSRYALDHLLAKVAREKGISVIHENVTNVHFQNNKHTITAGDATVTADIVLGAFGKRSLLDKKLERKFIERKTGWLAVKGHYKTENYPEDVVALHNFKGGYCGLSRTEAGVINVCYLATYESFKKYKDIEVYKEEVLCRNKHLADFFSNSTPLFDKDLTIAQISFEKKSRIENHILMLGDAAALIHPLCGNGMAMAIHSGKLASEIIIRSLKNSEFEREELERSYSQQWEKLFSSRLKMGRILQTILLNSGLAEISQSAIRLFPGILPEIIKRTHGTTVI